MRRAPISRIWLSTAAVERGMLSRLPLLAAFLLPGCMQLPVTASVTVPPIPAGEARIWFYRDNEAYVGIAELGGAFYRDVPPWRYHVTVETNGVDFNQTADLDLAAGQQAYV